MELHLENKKEYPMGLMKDLQMATGKVIYLALLTESHLVTTTELMKE